MTWRRAMAGLVAVVSVGFSAWLWHTDTFVLIPLVGIAAGTAVALMLLVERDEREQRVLDALNRSAPLAMDMAGFARASTAHEIGRRIGMPEAEVERHLRRRANHDPRVWLAEVPHGGEAPPERMWVIQHQAVVELLNPTERTP